MGQFSKRRLRLLCSLRNIPLKKHMLLLHRLLCLQQHTGPWCIQRYNISNCFMAYIFFPEEIQQPSIDICNLSSFGDVVYNERW
jgi:hypothetical protein